MPARKTTPPTNASSDAKPKRQPRGAVKPWTKAEIDRRSRVTDADVEDAASTWRRHAVPTFKPLLDATEVDE